MSPQTMPDVKQINSFDDADEALLQLGRIEARLQDYEAQMNNEIQKMREKYDEKTVDLRSSKEQLERMLEKFVVGNKKEFNEDRSRESLHGTIGLRLGKSKVELVNKKFTWKKVLDLLQDVKWGKEFIRSTPEINKDGIIKAFNAKEINENKLAGVGIRVDQSDNFFYVINWDSLN